jgi:hypothetical protein
MSNLNSLLESSASGWKNMQNESAAMANKWGKTGLLEGIGSEVDKNSMAMILENQAKQLVVEASANTTGTGNGTFTAGTGAQWAGVALPLVRKVFGSLSTKEFMSVQPMNLPSGLVFFLDFQYGTEKEKDFGPAGTVFSDPASIYGDTSPTGKGDPTGGLYGAGRFAYSTQQTQSVATATSSGSATWAQVDFQADKSASIAAGTTFSFVTIAGPSNLDTKGVRAFTLSSGSTNFNEANLLPEFTSIDSSDNVTFVFNANGAAASSAFVGNDYTVKYNVAPTDQSRGDFEDISGGGFPNATSETALSIPEIDVKMKSEAIVAKTKKLKAQWTPEFAQDLNAYQSLDAEAELTSIMSEYISLEIDLENLDMLIQDASAADEYWNAQNNQSLNSDNNGYNDLGFYNTQGQWFQTLGTKFQKVSNKIHQKTLRGGANFLVCSPTVATVLESIPGYASSSDGDATKASYAFGIQKSGQLNNRFTVYKNPYMTENVVLLGYRGSQFLETGAVFSPYVPLIMTPLVYDPDTFTPRKGLLTRYAKKMIRPEFYGRVFCSNLSQV